MEIELFKSIADDIISSDPTSRLSKKSKHIFQQDNYIVDVHCHLFDIRTINIKYFLLRLLKDRLGLRNDQAFITLRNEKYKYLTISTDDLYKNYPSEDFDLEGDKNWNELLSELEFLEADSILKCKRESGKRGITDILRNRKLLSFKNMMDVYNYYIENYALNAYNISPIKGKDIFITALMMDLETGWDLKTRKPFIEQISELKILANDSQVLPFFCIDPRRANLTGSNNLYSLFLYAFSSEPSSFFGVKVYPGMGYLPSDYRLLPIYEVCEKKNIPIITHCGGDTITSHNIEIEAFRLTDKVIIKGRNRQETAKQLNDPREWIPVLEKYKNLKLNFGHFGGSSEWYEFQTKGRNTRINTIIDIIESYEFVFADFSYNIINSGLYSIYKTVLDTNKSVLKKSLYGSDFWVVCAAGNLKIKQDQFLNKNVNLILTLSYQNSKRFLFEKSFSRY